MFIHTPQVCHSVTNLLHLRYPSYGFDSIVPIASTTSIHFHCLVAFLSHKVNLSSARSRFLFMPLYFQVTLFRSLIVGLLPSQFYFITSFSFDKEHKGRASFLSHLTKSCVQNITCTLLACQVLFDKPTNYITIF